MGVVYRTWVLFHYNISNPLHRVGKLKLGTAAASDKQEPQEEAWTRV